jgi:glycosyltransferase involved in cell wall biosynthesis
MCYRLPHDFDWQFYLTHYSDLRDAGYSDSDSARAHYLEYGAREGRIYNQNPHSDIAKGKRLWKRMRKFNGHDLRISKNHALNSARISVIISLYNYDHYIKNCIDSVLANEFDGVEIVVVNDRSTDRSIEVVMPYLDTSHPFTLLNKKVRTGLVHSRNLGIDHSVGEYVFILDADNAIYADCLSAHFDYLSNSHDWACYGVIECFNPQGKWVKNLSDKPFKLDLLMEGNYIDAMALFDKSRLLSIGKYDQNMVRYGIGWEDHELWLRMGKLGGTVGFIDKRLSKYLLKSDSMSEIAHRQYSPNLRKYLNAIHQTNL